MLIVFLKIENGVSEVVAGFIHTLHTVRFIKLTDIQFTIALDFGFKGIIKILFCERVK